MWLREVEGTVFMRLWSSVPIAVAACTLSGCLIVPYKAKPITETSAGAVNRDVLQPGTPRTSVTEVFGDSLVAAGPHLAWVRVQFSNSGMFFFAAGYYSAVDWDGRVWQTQNLMIEFDEQDRVRQHRIVSDSMLLPEVDKLLNDGSLETPTFTAPVTVTFVVERVSRVFPIRATERLTLSEDGISWARGNKAKVEAAPAALTNVRHRKGCPAPNTSQPERLNENLCASFDLQISGKPMHVTARVSARDLFMLVAYARKFRHASDPGE
jgi:hypothetical protein